MPDETDTQTEAPAQNVGGLDAILAKLDDTDRAAVRGELKKARDEAAKYRTRSREFADDEAYERAKAAVTKLDEIEQAQKTEAEKAADRATTAEKERDTLRTELLRTRVGARHKLPDSIASLLTGGTEEEMEERAKAIAAELGEARGRPADALPSTPKPVTSPGAGGSDPLDPAQIAEQALKELNAL